MPALTLTTYPYTPADLEDILALVKTRPASQLNYYPCPADLRELFALPRIQAAARLWRTPSGGLAGGQLAGYALLNYGVTYADLAYETAPGFEALAEEMLDWGEQTYRDLFHGDTTNEDHETMDENREVSDGNREVPGGNLMVPELTVAAYDSQPARIALLERRGYQRDPESVVHMQCDLAGSLVGSVQQEFAVREPQIPVAPSFLLPGFTIRRAVDIPVEDWVALFRAALGTENMTVEGRLAITAAPDYDPDLDLVAVTPDGIPASYVVGGIHPEENALTGELAGYTDPVGTAPAYQRRGLCRALLLECMRRLRQRGMRVARLGTSSANLPMQRAAESVGFKIVDKSWHYARTFTS